MRYVFLAFVFVIVTVLSLFGFRGHKFTEPPVEVFPDMDRQARVNFQSGSEFFADGLGSRYPVHGTVPVGFDMPEKTAAEGGGIAEFGFSFPGDSSYYNTGRIGDFWGNGMPEEIRKDGKISEEFIKRGKERYNISCAICHGESGNGAGVVSKYGLPNIANFYSPPFSEPSDAAYRADGSIFNTITHGQGLMGSYGAEVTVQDRWAIIAYIRTLQVSAAAGAGEKDAAPAPTPAPAKSE
jgi:mono/diheme cytochrome c family protein